MGRDICAKALFLVSLLICQESIVVARNIQNGKNSIPRMESGLRSTTQAQTEKSVLLETQQQKKIIVFASISCSDVASGTRIFERSKEGIYSIDDGCHDKKL